MTGEQISVTADWVRIAVRGAGRSVPIDVANGAAKAVAVGVSGRRDQRSSGGKEKIGLARVSSARSKARDLHVSNEARLDF